MVAAGSARRRPGAPRRRGGGAVAAAAAAALLLWAAARGGGGGAPGAAGAVARHPGVAAACGGCFAACPVVACAPGSADPQCSPYLKTAASPAAAAAANLSAVLLGGRGGGGGGYTQVLDMECYARSKRALAGTRFGRGLYRGHYHALVHCAVPAAALLARVLGGGPGPGRAAGAGGGRTALLAPDYLGEVAAAFAALSGGAADAVRAAMFERVGVPRGASVATYALHAPRTPGYEAALRACAPCLRAAAHAAAGLPVAPGGPAAADLAGPVLAVRREGTRAIADFGDLVAALRAATGGGPGGVRVFHGNESLADTVRAFAAASAVVGYHGAGLANAVFCRPGALVLEVTTYRTPARYYDGPPAARPIWRTNWDAARGTGVAWERYPVEHDRLEPRPLEGHPDGAAFDWDHHLKGLGVRLGGGHVAALAARVARHRAEGTVAVEPPAAGRGRGGGGGGAP